MDSTNTPKVRPRFVFDLFCPTSPNIPYTDSQTHAFGHSTHHLAIPSTTLRPFNSLYSPLVESILNKRLAEVGHNVSHYTKYLIPMQALLTSNIKHTLPSMHAQAQNHTLEKIRENSNLLTHLAHNSLPTANIRSIGAPTPPSPPHRRMG